MSEVIEVNSSDIQAYVESRLNKKTPNETIKPQHVTPDRSDVFYLDRDEYIAYLIAKRDSNKKQFKRSLIWHNLRKVLIWLLKFIIGCIIFCLIAYGFYLLVWFMQNNLYHYRINMLAR